MSARKIKLRIDYGTDGLEIEVPEARTTVIEPKFRPGLSNPIERLRDSLRNPTGSGPLRERVEPGQRVAISVCDITRPQPRREMLTAIFEELSQLQPENFVILVATGTHRANTAAELRDMFGERIVNSSSVFSTTSK